MLEQRIGVRRVVGLAVHDLPVEAGPLDRSRERGEAVAVERVPNPAQFGEKLVALADDRHERLAHQVTAEDERVDLVERGGGEELPERQLRAVQVGGEEDAGRAAHLRRYSPSDTTIVFSDSQ